MHEKQLDAAQQFGEAFIYTTPADVVASSAPECASIAELYAFHILLPNSSLSSDDTASSTASATWASEEFVKSTTFLTAEKKQAFVSVLDEISQSAGRKVGDGGHPATVVKALSSERSSTTAMVARSPSKGSKRVAGKSSGGAQKASKGKKGKAGTTPVPSPADLWRNKTLGVAAGVVIVMLLFRLLSGRKQGGAIGRNLAAILLAPVTMVKLIFGERI